MNPVSYFEIPVHDLARAMAFYHAVFGAKFECATVHGCEMAFFDYDETQPGASGALVQGESYLPGLAGARVYFSVSDLPRTLQRAQQAGGQVRLALTDAGAFGQVAEIEDSEGNCIALRSCLAAPDLAAA